MSPKTALLTALLVQASVQPVQAHDPLHHWRHVCDKPQLDYWQQLCRRGPEFRITPPTAQPAADPTQEQKTTETAKAPPSDARSN